MLFVFRNVTEISSQEIGISMFCCISFENSNWKSKRIEALYCSRFCWKLVQTFLYIRSLITSRGWRNHLGFIFSQESLSFPWKTKSRRHQRIKFLFFRYARMRQFRCRLIIFENCLFVILSSIDLLWKTAQAILFYCYNWEDIHS